MQLFSFFILQLTRFLFDDLFLLAAQIVKIIYWQFFYQPIWEIHAWRLCPNFLYSSLRLEHNIRLSNYRCFIIISETYLIVF